MFLINFTTIYSFRVLRKFLQKSTFLLILLIYCFGFTQNHDSKKVIIIDPGHGGIDSGAMGFYGTSEKDIVLLIAQQIVLLNKSLFKNKLDIYMTRSRDTFISLMDRSNLALALQADLFISLHCNASKGNSQGMEVFVYSGGAEMENLQNAIALAYEIISESSNNLGLKSRGIKFANFQVLRETIDICPSILIETGFISDSLESSYLTKKSNVRAVALSILMGIYKWTE